MIERSGAMVLYHQIKLYWGSDGYDDDEDNVLNLINFILVSCLLKEEGI